MQHKYNTLQLFRPYHRNHQQRSIRKRYIGITFLEVADKHRLSLGISAMPRNPFQEDTGIWFREKPVLPFSMSPEP